MFIEANFRLLVNGIPFFLSDQMAAFLTIMKMLTIYDLGFLNGFANRALDLIHFNRQLLSVWEYGGFF
jgi:hypothetical protein